MRKKVKKQPHQWGGAGYVCAACGAIKSTDVERGDCPGAGKTGFDLWLYHAGAGWWLHESEIETSQQAAKLGGVAVGKGNVVAMAVLPAGQPLGLFTKRYGT